MDTSLLADYLPMLSTLGHVLLGVPFVAAGLRHLRIIDSLALRVSRRGIPFPRACILAGTALQIVAGATLTLSLFVAPSAIVLMGFTLLAGLMLLDFWNAEGSARASMINMWLSNAAVIGGLCVAAAADLR